MKLYSKIITIVFLTCSAALCTSGCAAAAPVKDENMMMKSGSNTAVKGSYIISGAASATEDDVKKLCSGYVVASMEKIGEGVFSVQFGEGSDPGLTELEARIKKSVLFKAVQPNFIYKASPMRGKKNTAY